MKPLINASIFVPVLNEEANIKKLVVSLFAQKQVQFVLEKVVVLSDGSTDKTAEIVSELSKKYPRLVLVDDTIRHGVTYRLNQIRSLNKSDVAICFDGDTLPQNEFTLENLVKVFKDKKVKLATARLTPISPKTIFEKMLFAWRKVWSVITSSWKSGNNIYNFRGAGLAMKKDFLLHVQVPATIVGASSHYLYLYAKKHSIKTAFCQDSIICYRLATSLRDYLLQTNRGQDDNKLLKNLFLDLYDKERIIPSRLKFFYILKCLGKNPFQTFIGITFNAIIPFLNSKKTPSDSNGSWQTARSTKSLQVNNYRQ